MITEGGLIILHKKSWRNRELLRNAKVCICFYCFKQFSFSGITKWTDENETALCPSCAIDAVLGFEIEPVDQTILLQMHERWFQRTIRQ